MASLNSPVPQEIREYDELISKARSLLSKAERTVLKAKELGKKKSECLKEAVKYYLDAGMVLMKSRKRCKGEDRNWEKELKVIGLSKKQASLYVLIYRWRNVCKDAPSLNAAVKLARKARDEAKRRDQSEDENKDDSKEKENSDLFNQLTGKMDYCLTTLVRLRNRVDSWKDIAGKFDRDQKKHFHDHVIKPLAMEVAQALEAFEVNK